MRNKIRKPDATWRLRLCGLVIFVLAASGCAHHYPPEIAGRRINSDGKVIQTIVRVEKGVEHSALITPEGPKQYETFTCRYYLQEDNKPEREFLIGNSCKNAFLGDFLAVSNSTLWVTSFEEKIISYNADENDFYIFDLDGYLRHRTFTILQKSETNVDADYTFEDGNRTLVFKSPNGLKKYNLLDDTVTDVEPAVNGTK